MHVWVTPKPHSHIKCGMRFPPLYHTCYKWGCYSTPLHKDIFSGCYVLDCPIKGQQSGLCSQFRARNQFLSLSLIPTRTLSHYQMLVVHSAFNLISDIMPWDPPRGQLRSYKLLNRTTPGQLVGDFISSYPIMSRDPIQPHSAQGRDIIQCLFTLLYQLRHCVWPLLYIWLYTHLNYDT